MTERILNTPEELDFGPVKPTEGKRVEDILGEATICNRCGATLATYSDLCNVPLDEPCQGFLLIEGTRLHIRRKADG